MQTYAAALARTRRRLTGGTKTTTYPPSPLTNTVFAALPGSCGGDCAFTRASAEFVTNPERPASAALLKALNAPEDAVMISELLARDHDYVRDRLVRRGYTPVDRGRRNRPMRAVDGYFLPTLFATEWLNFSQWPGYPQRPTKPWGSRRWAKGLLTTHRFDPARYFAVVLTPWRRWTLCIINLSRGLAVRSQGPPRGRRPRTRPRQGSAPAPRSSGRRARCGSLEGGDQEEELAYWRVANHIARRHDGFDREFNLPVPPLESISRPRGLGRLATAARTRLAAPATRRTPTTERQPE